MKRALLPILLTALAFTACRKENKMLNEQVVTISEKNCTQNIFGDASVFLCLDSVQDSRCPSDVECVWSGVAQARFTFTSNNQQYHFILSTNRSFGSITDTVIQQYNISLVNIFPYPMTSSPNTASKIAEVRITR